MSRYYTQHLIKNWQVAFHALHDFFAHFIHGLIPAIKIRHHQPDIIRCKDCVYQTESWIGIKYCEAHGDHIGKDYDYCSNARRKENGH